MNKPKILIADDDKELVAALEYRCRQIGLDVVVAYDAMTALILASRSGPQLICVDVDMPAGNGLSVCEMLTNNRDSSCVPIIVLTGRTDEDVVRRCHEMCVYYVLKKADVWPHLEPLIRDLLNIERPAAPDSSAGHDLKSRSAAPEPPTTAEPPPSQDAAPPQRTSLSDTARQEVSIPRVLCIDDDPDLTWALKRRLEEHGVAVIRAHDGADGYRTAFNYQADVILLDYEMPRCQGDYVLRRLKEFSDTKQTPVIVLTGHKNKSLERKMFNLGASAFLNKPVEFSALRKELARHIELAPQLTDAGRSGPLPKAAATSP